MWALSLAATQTSLSMLPAGMRPMPVSEALQRISRANDAHAGARMWMAFGMMEQGTAALQQLVRANQADAADALIPDGVLKAISVAYAAFLQASVGSVVALLEALCERQESPCFDVTSCGTFSGNTLKTSLDSYVAVRKPLSKVAPLLDPRAWASCSDLFRRTCQVAKPIGCDPVCLPAKPADLGTDWKGELYERAVVGYQEVENLLSIDLAACDVGTAKGRLKIDYSLFRSISHRFGGWEFPGLMRNNSGTITATAVAGGKDLQPDAEPPHTRIRVTKLVHYGRAGSWSGTSALDVGELCNYLAPAFLTLWVANVKFVVPCCPDRDR